MRVAAGCGLLVAMALTGVVVVMCSARHRNITERQAVEQYWAGHRAVDRGDHEAAIAHYRAYRSGLQSIGSDDSEVLGMIGHCHAQLGRYDEAMRAFDESLVAERRWHVCVEKAVCMAQRDEAAALVWLASEPFDKKLRLRAQSSFHRRCGNYTEACVALRALLQLNGVARWFDGEELRPTDLAEVERHNGFVEVLNRLEDLAWCEFGRGEFESAETAAHQALAGHQRLLGDKSWIDPPQVEAGSLACRLVLTKIAMKRKDWQSAREHLHHAEHLHEVGGWTSFEAELRKVQAGMADYRD